MGGKGLLWDLFKQRGWIYVAVEARGGQHPMLESDGERHELHWKNSRVWHWYCGLGYRNWEVCGTVNRLSCLVCMCYC